MNDSKEEMKSNSGTLLKFIEAATLVLAMSGCSLGRTPGASRVEVVVPDLSGTNNISLWSNFSDWLYSPTGAKGSLDRQGLRSPALGTQPGLESWDGGIFVPLANPTQISDFDCLGIHVTGQELAADAAMISSPGVCSTTPPVSLLNPGKILGLLPITGGNVSLELPVWASVQLQLFGLNTSDGACPEQSEFLKDLSRFATHLETQDTSTGAPDISGMRLYGLPFEVASSRLTITEDTTLRLSPALEPGALRPVFCDGTTALRARFSFSSLSLGSSEFSLSDTLPDLSRGFEGMDLRVTLLTDFQQHIQRYSESSPLTIQGGTLVSEPTEIAPGVLEWHLTVNDLDSFSVGLQESAAIDVYGRTSSASDSASQAGLLAQLKAQVLASGFGSYSPPSSSRSLISVSAASVSTGSQITVTFTGIDSQGNPVTQGGETIAFSLGGGTSTGTFSTVTDHGNGTYSAVFTAGAAGTPATISGTINGLAVTTTLPAVQVLSSSATTLVFTQDITGTPEAGQPLTVEVRALDTYGQVASTFSGTVSLTLNSAGNGATLGGTTSLNAVAGVAQFTGLSISHAGAGYTLQATASGLSATGAPFGVSAGSLSVATSTVSLSTSALAAGGSITVTLTAKNPHGALITTGGAAVSFSTSPSGVGTFSSVTDQNNGTYTASYSENYVGYADIMASINGVQVTSESPRVTITAGTATQIQLSNTPSATASAGAPFGTAPVVAIRDAYGNLVSNWATPVSVAAYTNSGCTTASAATLINASVTPSSGIANFSGLTSQGIGVLYLRFSSGALGLCVPTPVSVSIGAPSVSQSSVAISGGATSIATGSTVTAILTVRDAAGNAYLTSPGATVTFSRSGGTSIGNFGSVTDNLNGTYSVSFTGVSGGTPTQIQATLNGTAVTSTATLLVRTPLPSNDVRKVLVVGGRIYVGTCGGGLAYSDDGGSHWTVKTTSNGLGHNCVFDIYVDGLTLYAATSGGFSISTNGGDSWINKTKEANGLGGNEVVGIAVLGGGVIYAASRNPIDAYDFAGPSRSGDSGATWTNTAGGEYLNNVAVGGGYVFAARTGGGGLMRTSSSITQAPWNWSNVLDDWVTGVYIYNGVVYATTYYGVLHVSQDYGNTWTPNNLGGSLKKAVPSGSTLYVATDSGIRISPDGGTTWTATKTTADGLGNNLAEDLFVDGTTIYAATSGGLSISTDSGNSWINISATAP